MEQQQQVPTQTPPKQQIMLMTERFAQEYIHIYNNLKNKYKIKFIKNQNFHADCIVNNMPFLFVLNDSPNIDNRINLFIKSFASRHVILFNNNWNLYEKLIVSNIENNNRNIQMYYSGDTIEDFENTIMSFSKLKSQDKVSKITTYVDSIINDIFPYTQDGLINAISQTLHINEREAETVLNSHRSLYLLSKSSEENANTLLSLTPIDKQSIVLLYNFLSN